MNELKIIKIGEIAAETLAMGGVGKVIGITSKGVFIRFGDRILFLTSADYRSPFNLTLANPNQKLEQLQPGDSVEIHQESLFIPIIETVVQTEDAVKWTPPAPVVIQTSLVQQLRMAEAWVDTLYRLDPLKGYLFLANEIPETEPFTAQHTRGSVAALLENFRSHNLEGFLKASLGLLGSGGGLTPSGDDFLAGFFLYHVRYDQAASVKRGFISEWNSEVSQLAFQKTTTISANRLAAAGRGWSEDLFLQLIDALFDSSVKLERNYFNHLLDFGHSSGVDTFMGIYFALQSLT
jgi:hypothetical protein